MACISAAADGGRPFRPNATPAQVELAIKQTAHKYGDGAPYLNRTSFDKGYGSVDVAAAAAHLAAMVPLS